MDNASAYGAEDSRFESWQGRMFCHQIETRLVNLGAAGCNVFVTNQLQLNFSVGTSEGFLLYFCLTHKIRSSFRLSAFHYQI